MAVCKLLYAVSFAPFHRAVMDARCAAASTISAVNASDIVAYNAPCKGLLPRDKRAKATGTHVPKLLQG